MEELTHECGIAALYHMPVTDGTDGGVSSIVPRIEGQRQADQVTRLIPRMLLDLQNRGQLAAGFSSYDPNRPQLIDTYKQIGLVSEALRLNHPRKAEEIFQQYSGTAAIGHVRYATSGDTGRSCAQPFERRHGCRWKWFTFAYNGQLANVGQLRDELMKLSGYHLVRDTDTEVIMHYLAHELRGDDPPDLVDVFGRLTEKFDGAYNLVFLNAMGDMVVVRDPHGFRPLCWANDGRLFGAASESVALSNLGFKDVQPVRPGEILVFQNGTFRRETLATSVPKSPKHCFFEWIYFANVASTLDERSVYLARSRLGRELARQEVELDRVPLDSPDTIVVPVPDTGKAAADAMAHELGLPSVEGLMRNRYVGRTFIQGSNREQQVRQKFTPLREVLEGKRVLLVEDSIVRSTTLQVLLGHIRNDGRAKEIHVRVACPPIVAPCFYGIDMSSVGELFAPRFLSERWTTRESFDAMAAELGADSLAYLPLEALARSVGLDASHLCRACLTGDYPTPAGERLYQLALRETPGQQGRLVERDQSWCRRAEDSSDY